MNETIARLKRYVAYPTISSNPVIELASDLAQGAEDLGFSVHMLESTPSKVNVLATIGPQEHSLVLSGHMDVVPTEGQDWTGDPFKLRQLDDRLVGRGSCDMKGFIASTMTVLQSMRMETLKRGLALVWTHDEEVGCLGSQQFVSKLPELGYSLPKSILIGEPTGMTYARKHGGHTSLKVEIIGKAAHSSKPRLGCSAIKFAVSFVALLNDLEQTWCDHPINVEGTTCFPLLNVAQITGGEAINIIPNHCTVKIGLRAMPTQNSLNLIEAVKDRLDNLTNHPEWIDIDAHIKVIQDAPPLHTCSGSRLEEHLIEQGCLEGGTLPFATDGGWFSRTGAQPIICGPGQIDVAHQPDEYITVSDLRQSNQFLRRLISDWTTQEAP